MRPNNTILALDVGGRRIGVAIASAEARIAQPLTTLTVDDNTIKTIVELAAEQAAQRIVIGLPRNLSGEDTDQTRLVRAFATELQAAFPSAAISFQDEALTSREAEKELQARGRPYEKADIDTLAATYILEDYLRDNPREVAA